MGSQEAGAGSPLQEVSSGRSGALLGALAWEEGVSWGCEAREAGAKSLLWHTILLGRRVQAVQHVRRRKPAAPVHAFIT